MDFLPVVQYLLKAGPLESSTHSIVLLERKREREREKEREREREDRGRGGGSEGRAGVTNVNLLTRNNEYPLTCLLVKNLM